MISFMMSYEFVWFQRKSRPNLASIGIIELVSLKQKIMIFAAQVGCKLSMKVEH